MFDELPPDLLDHPPLFDAHIALITGTERPLLPAGQPAARSTTSRRTGPAGRPEGHPGYRHLGHVHGPLRRSGCVHYIADELAGPPGYSSAVARAPDRQVARPATAFKPVCANGRGWQLGGGDRGAQRNPVSHPSLVRAGRCDPRPCGPTPQPVGDRPCCSALHHRRTAMPRSPVSSTASVRAFRRQGRRVGHRLPTSAPRCARAISGLCRPATGVTAPRPVPRHRRRPVAGRAWRTQRPPRRTRGPGHGDGRTEAPGRQLPPPPHRRPRLADLLVAQPKSIMRPAVRRRCWRIRRPWRLRRAASMAPGISRPAASVRPGQFQLRGVDPRPQTRIPRRGPGFELGLRVITRWPSVRTSNSWASG